MMLQSVEKLEGRATPQCTGEQARKLLEELRAAYQSLSTAERSLMTSIIWQIGRARLPREPD